MIQEDINTWLFVGIVLMLVIFMTVTYLLSIERRARRLKEESLKKLIASRTMSNFTEDAPKDA